MSALRRALGPLLVGCVLLAGCALPAAPAGAAQQRVPRRAGQLLVLSSPTRAPRHAIATLRAYIRVHSGGRWRWRRVFGPWPAETGAGHLVASARRREGDGSTPLGIFGFGQTIYGTRPDPGGLRYRYHRLVCGDWWDEDPYSRRYNRFVHVRCGVRPGFAAWSEALWTEPVAYPYFAVIDFNMRPIRRGRGAPGSGIFLHSWVGSATEGCVALPRARLLTILRWLRPSRHPAIEVGIGVRPPRPG